MSSRVGVVAAGLAVVLAVTLAACGGDNADEARAEKIRLLGADAVPATMLDLAVKAEDASRAKQKDDAFVEAIGLYSLRRDDLLQGVFQISRFTPEATVDKSSFRRRVVEQIGSTAPKTYRMGEHTVYLTTGRRQSVAIWFKGRDLFVLSTREEYEQPRALLREALEVDL